MALCNGNWNTLFTVNGYIGTRGLGKTVEGDRKTPVGVFTMGEAYGIKSNPGCHVNYTKINATHYWDGDSSSSRYNQFVSTTEYTDFSKSQSEHLIDFEGHYNYFMDIGYNTSGTPKKGSALFLHCSMGMSTGGCVAIPEKNMIQVIQNVQEGCKIIIGTKADILTH